jgi:hypothetical protein
MAKKEAEIKKREHRGIFLKKNHRGLSTVVVTLIIVLISLVAIAIMWATVKYFIERKAEVTEIESRFFTEQVDIVSVKSNEPLLNITLRRPSGEIKVFKSDTMVQVTVPLDADIFSVVDLSGSMRQCAFITETECDALGGNYPYPAPCDSLPASSQSGCISYGGTWIDKLTATQDSNKDLISNILSSGNTRMGLVGYRNAVVVSASTNLTTDTNLLNTTINSWQAMFSTCICCGINDATLKLNQQSTQEKLKSIIVMSDGEANQPCNAEQGTGNPKQDAIQAACDANSSLNNLIIWSIGVENADEATLTGISDCGGGRYFSVTNTSELIEVYRTIAQEIQDRYQSLTSLNYFAIIFYSANDSYKENIFDMPGVLQTKTYNFNLQGQLSGEVIRVEIYPVIVASNREEIVGPMVASWEAK